MLLVLVVDEVVASVGDIVLDTEPIDGFYVLENRELVAIWSVSVTSFKRVSFVSGNVYIGAETVPKVADSKLGIRENVSVDELAVDDPVFGKIEGNKFE